MPSTSKKQHNFMEAIANNKKFAEKVHVPQSVGRDFVKADKGKKFGKGGNTMMRKKMDPRVMAAMMAQQQAQQQPQQPMVAPSPAPMSAAPAGAPGMKHGGKTMKKMAKGGMTDDDMKQDKKMIKRAFGMHDKQEHKGEHTDLSKLKKGGMAMKKPTMKYEEYSKTGKPMGMKTVKMAQGGETMGPRSMSEDVEKGSNKLGKHGESKVQKSGHTRAMEPKMKGNDIGNGPAINTMKKGGMAKKPMKKMASGGMTSSASKRADGIAMKGKTNCKIC